MSWDAAFIASALPGRKVVFFASLPSTMLEAERQEPGTFVVAGAQTAGVGRHGNSWHSEDGAGLYFSVSLPLTSLLTLALGIATVEAIQQVTHVLCDLRWPNDVLLHERKLAGILVQSAGDRAIAGIGINVGQRSFPVDLRSLATSLAIETGLEFRREDIFVQLAVAISRWASASAEQIRVEFSRRSSYVQGRRVIVAIHGRDVVGVTTGLTTAGFLQLRSDEGKSELIIAGGVRPA